MLLTEEQTETSFLLVQDQILYINPLKSKESSTIYLSESKKSWITINWLSDDLLNYSSENYHHLFDLHPLQRGKVVMFDNDVVSPRWHRSYLHQPKINPELKRSYMYSGKDKFEDLSLPFRFQPFLDFLNEKEEEKYNQVIVNWYENGKDYIAPHSDCLNGIVANSGITIITLCEDEIRSRELRFIPKNLVNERNDSLYKQVKINMKHGCVITMYGNTQKYFRHSIPKDLTNPTSRISLTFRKFENQ